MAAKTGTYTLINSTTSDGTSGSITFSSIPSTYTDLVIVVNFSASATDAYMRFNSDTASNYSNTILGGSGSSAGSARSTNRGSIYLDWSGFTLNSIKNNAIINIMDYANTTTYKTALIRFNDSATTVEAHVALWRSTAAINSVTILAGGNFTSGSTFKLYGIEAGNL